MNLIARMPVVYRVVGDRVVLGLQDGTFVTLEGIAADLWLLLDVPRSESELRVLLAETLANSETGLGQAIEAGVRQIRGVTVSLGDEEEHRRPNDCVRLRPADQVLGSGSTSLVAQNLGPNVPVPAALAAMQWSVGIGQRVSGEADLSAAQLCARERIIPGLASALRSGGLVPGRGVPSFVAASERNIQLHAIECERTLVAVLAEMEFLGVESRVLKGVATAHLDFADAELRQFGDVDLLARADDHPAIIGRLVALGFRHVIGGDPGPYRLYKSNYLISPNSVEIDLHHRLFRHGLPAGDAIWENPETWELAGANIAALPRPWRLVHASVHAMLSRDRSRRLSGFLDPVRIAMTDPAAIPEAHEISARLGLSTLFLSGLRTSCEMLGAPEYGDGIEPLGRRSVHDVIAMWAFDGSERHLAREQISLMLGLPPADAIQWLVRWFLPSRGYRGPSLRERVASTARSSSSTP